MQSLGPRPYPGEDTATTRDSDDYLEKNGLGTRETASPGELSPTGSVNELLKQVATDNNVSPKLPRNSSVLTFSLSGFAGICC